MVLTISRKLCLGLFTRRTNSRITLDVFDLSNIYSERDIKIQSHYKAQDSFNQDGGLSGADLDYDVFVKDECASGQNPAVEPV